MASIFDDGSEQALQSIVNDRVIAAINALDDKNAKAMAETTYATLQTIAEEVGMAKTEVLLRTPHDPRCYFANGNSYVVAWEAGPYQWAIGTSLEIGDKCGKLVEPYYSFDLCFYPDED